MVRIADFVGDGRLDLFFALHVAVNELYLNDGRGNFTRTSGRIPPLRDSSFAAAARD